MASPCKDLGGRSRDRQRAGPGFGCWGGPGYLLRGAGHLARRGRPTGCGPGARDLPWLRSKANSTKSDADGEGEFPVSGSDMEGYWGRGGRGVCWAMSWGGSAPC